jgi:hypothetical protein
MTAPALVPTPAPAPALHTSWTEWHNAQLVENVRNLPETLRAARSAAIRLSDAKLKLAPARLSGGN